MLLFNFYTNVQFLLPFLNKLLTNSVHFLSQFSSNLNHFLGQFCQLQIILQNILSSFIKILFLGPYFSHFIRQSCLQLSTNFFSCLGANFLTFLNSFWGNYLASFLPLWTILSVTTSCQISKLECNHKQTYSYKLFKYKEEV